MGDGHGFDDIDLGVAFSRVERACDELSELGEWAEDEGLRAVAHKLQEAWGPVNSAMTALIQYDTGVLDRKY